MIIDHNELNDKKGRMAFGVAFSNFKFLITNIQRNNLESTTMAKRKNVQIEC